MFLLEILADEFRDLSDRVLGRDHTVGVQVFGKPDIWLEDRQLSINPNRVSFKMNRDRTVHTVYIWGYIVGDDSGQTSYSCTLDEAPEWVRQDFCES